MQKLWEGSVHIDAPVGQVFPYLADFYRHPEWDRLTLKVEKTKDGDSSGAGAEWRIHETCDLFSLGPPGAHVKQGTGLAKRVVKEVVPNKTVAWHAHPIPKLGISTDYLYQVESDGDGTKVTQRVTVNVPGVLDKVARLVAKNLDSNLRQIWPQSLQRLETLVTRETRPV
jgi:uncharacterized membrane protein